MSIISGIFANIWKAITMVLAVITAGLFIMLQVTKSQEEKARRKADDAKRDAALAKAKYRKAKQHADVVKKTEQQAKDEVAQARERARAGKRDHFSRGMHDD